MGNTDAESPAKSDKASSQLQKANVHPYSEWAAMPAYYGAGVGIPPPYFGSAVVSGHAAHPYMWGPQPMMPPFGNPYPPMYPNGSGFHHSSVPLGSPAQGQGSTNCSTSDAMNVSPQSTEVPAKTSSSGKEHCLMKKLKGFDGLVVSPNEDDEDARGSPNKHFRREGGTDGSSDGANLQEGNGTQQKRICSEETSANGKNGKDGMQGNNEDMNATEISLSVASTQPTISGKATEAPINMTSGKEFNISPAKSKTFLAPIPLSNAAPVQSRDGLPPEHWIQDERELKRERRKQSNRESARRSRLRKQAETEELSLKVENLASENAALKEELSRLAEMSEKLRQENSALMEKLENPVGGDSIGTSGKFETQDAQAVNLENLLSRVNDSVSSDGNEQQEGTTRENSSAKKLHQLLEPRNRTDTLTAG